jgi:hypothetical protein
MRFRVPVEHRRTVFTLRYSPHYEKRIRRLRRCWGRKKIDNQDPDIWLAEQADYQNRPNKSRHTHSVDAIDTPEMKFRDDAHDSQRWSGAATRPSFQLRLGDS